MSDILIRGMEMPKDIEPGLVIEFADGIDGKRYARLWHYRHGGLTEWLEAVSAADVRPVVRGRWNAVKGALHPAETSAVCSNCGFATMIHAQTFYHFCPNCGADMSAEGDK